jgi:hypothetical protein
MANVIKTAQVLFQIHYDAYLLFDEIHPSVAVDAMTS